MLCEDWCKTEGHSTLDEVLDFFDDFAEALGWLGKYVDPARRCQEDVNTASYPTCLSTPCDHIWMVSVQSHPSKHCDAGLIPQLIIATVGALAKVEQTVPARIQARAICHPRLKILEKRRDWDRWAGTGPRHFLRFLRSSSMPSLEPHDMSLRRRQKAKRVKVTCFSPPPVTFRKCS